MGKAEYMSNIAKSSMQMAMNERDMAKISGAQVVVAKEAKNVRKYEDRIQMSTLTEKQDEELLGLASERATAAKNNMPNTDAAEKALSDIRVQDASLEKRLSLHEAEVMRLIAAKQAGPELVAAKEKVGKTQVDLDAATELKTKAKTREASSKAANAKAIAAKETATKAKEQHNKKQRAADKARSDERNSKADEAALKIKEGTEKAYKKAKEAGKKQLAA